MHLTKEIIYSVGLNHNLVILAMTTIGYLNLVRSHVVCLTIIRIAKISSKNNIL